MRVVLLGPSLQAVSGVSTHLNQLLSSDLNRASTLLHFQVGSEGKRESAWTKLLRIVASPLAFFVFLLRQRPAIVHLNTSLATKSYWRDIAYLAVARLLGRKVVYQVHGGALPQDFFCGDAVLTWLLRRVLSAADVVVLLAQVELRAYRQFVPKVRLEVIANAIDAAALVTAPLSSKCDRSTLHVGYLGRFDESKGIFTTLEALSELIRDGRDILLTLAGSGPDDSRLKAMAVGLKIQHRIRFAGPLFGAAKDALWRDVQVFSFPTTHREGLPYALLEAMAAGAVPITTKVGAIPDVLQDGVQGFLIEPNNGSALARAIARLDDDRALLARMAVAGRERIMTDYTVNRLASDFQRLYTDLAGN